MGNNKTNAQNNLINMMALDMYCEGISKTQYKEIRRKIQRSQSSPGPLLSWDYFLDGYRNSIRKAELTRDRFELEFLSKKHLWKNAIDEIINDDYDGLVLTDTNLIIQWVNQGFTEMTGYTAKYAVGQSPRFLQGVKTTDESRQRIRRKIEALEPFRDTVVNYRKTGEEYACEILVKPLFTHSGNVSHFIALERELAA